jgi:hypothetical protein
MGLELLILMTPKRRTILVTYDGVGSCDGDESLLTILAPICPGYEQD